MPNTFIALDVPATDTTGVPAITTQMGSLKTFVFAAHRPPGGRYVIEGSNDGGNTWDILVGLDGTEAVFGASTTGVRAIEAVVDQLRVRSIGNGPVPSPPSITVGAPPAGGTNVFGVFDVPGANGVGAPFDLGPSTGPTKTFTLRGTLPAGARYSILASMDGVHFNEVALIRADNDGAKAASVTCRFLQVSRNATGQAPVIAFGAEGLVDPTADGLDLSIADDGERTTSSLTAEEVFAEYAVPLGSLGGPSVGVTFAGISIQGEGAGSVTFRVRIGGTLQTPDGIEAVKITDTVGSQKSILGGSDPIPVGPGATIVKVTGQGDGAVAAALRGFVLLFHPIGT